MKKNIKLFIGILIGIIISGISVYAVTVIGRDVTYDNTDSGLTSTNVQGAVDELYEKINATPSAPAELLGIGKWGGPTSYSYVAPQPGYYLMIRGSGGSDTPFTWEKAPISTFASPLDSNAYGFKIFLFHATSADEVLVSYSNSNPSGRYAPSTSFWKLNIDTEPTITSLAVNSSNSSNTQTSITSDKNIIYLGIEGGEYFYNTHSPGYWISASDDASLSIPTYNDIGLNIYHHSIRFYKFYNSGETYILNLLPSSGRSETGFFAITY